MIIKFLLNSLSYNFTAKTPFYFVRNIQSRNMSKKALVLLAEGAEEMEAVISIDVLRRGGIDVAVAGVPNKIPIQCSRGVIVNPTISIDEAKVNGPYDVVVLPGGLQGAKNLGANEAVGAILKEQEKSGRLIAAICAAPALVLKAHGIAEGRNVTSYPSFEKELTSNGKYHYSQEKVVVDGNITTSRGPGTALDFSLSLVSQLMGKEKASEIAKALLVPY
ncbi:protein/nucleic acid deglycase DJ-1 [Agrilus planipennis]|uniref:Protein/nucleic acid deglycase DJ-1 n=1 Tax=Agrilus planipennis TaxID=224129 RepID=A0A1W4XB01_AGRPL|nr:protein/nucleic acid deglycase DJ-1 [Agrilus planipennis]